MIAVLVSRFIVFAAVVLPGVDIDGLRGVTFGWVGAGSRLIV